jgi:protein tyrosine/serine phosphatase
VSLPLPLVNTCYYLLLPLSLLINYNSVLKLMANKSNYPLALYCTAGKDRTGIVIALALLCLGIPEQAILDDYTLSDDAYAQLEDKAAMVGALQQHDLDADTFLRAPRSVMESTLQLLQVCAI